MGTWGKSENQSNNNKFNNKPNDNFNKCMTQLQQPYNYNNQSRVIKLNLNHNPRHLIDNIPPHHHTTVTRPWP